MTGGAPYILSIDAGTTGMTAMAFDLELRSIARAYTEFPQGFPQPGWVEHEATDILGGLDRTVAEVVREMGAAPAAVGITNQRETVFAIDVRTQAAIRPGIVWQDRRTAGRCRELQEAGEEGWVRSKTGLVLDPYFSGTKAQWMLENDAAVKEAGAAGALRFLTVDALIIHHLTGGESLATDPTNASRTLFVDLDEPTSYDEKLMGLFGVQRSMLAPIQPSASAFGTARFRGDAAGTSAAITGVLGDQQAALFGQGGFDPGTLKNTYGTGCFLLLNTGQERKASAAGLLTTIAADRAGRPVYALEGSSFAGGTVIQWMRDQLGLFERSSDSEALARSVDDSGGVVLVPAFAGLGSPHWDPDARAAIFGMTRGTSKAHIARAGLDAIALQCADLIDAMRADSGGAIERLLVDGGAAANDFLMQRQADLASLVVERPKDLDSTARGAAAIAAVGAGLLQDPADAGAFTDTPDRFEPAVDDAERARERARWDDAVGRVLTR